MDKIMNIILSNNSESNKIRLAFKEGQKDIALRIQKILNEGGTSKTLSEDLEEEIKKYI